MRTLAVLVVMTCAAAADYAHAADTKGGGGTPILVELFTSEGCSSCPPADELLKKIDASQPISGAQLIVLSEHVDYWNHDGWKDPYSSSQLTDRQSAYVHVLGVSEPYTPQMIADGSSELRLRDLRQMTQIFQKEAAARKIPVRIESINLAGNVLRGHIETDINLEKQNADVYLAVALDHAESQVLRGENSGRHLTHVAVVQYLKKIGKLESGKSCGQDFQVKLKPGEDAGNFRIIAFLQEPGPGKVLGAALQRPPLQ
jgi:hypothetical protein